MPSNWRLIYQGEAFQRISLPTYPFERKRYWIPEFEKNKDKDKYKKDIIIISEQGNISVKIHNVLFKEITKSSSQSAYSEGCF